MIENLRYYTDSAENKIFVKWNWVGVSGNVKATCMLQKRLSNEIVRQLSEITLASFHENAGGCSFPMPNVPVKIVLVDDDQVPVECVVTNSPRYNIEYRAEVRDETVKRFLKKSVSTRYLRVGVKLPPEIAREEAAMIDGWVIGGSLRNHPASRFFLPSLRAGSNEYPQFEVARDFSAGDLSFDVVPEAKGTKYEDLFSFNAKRDRATTHASRYARDNCEKRIDFGNIGKRDEHGFCPVICPFCFETFSFRDFEYRAKSYDDNKGCFEAEIDEKYRHFCEDNNIHSASVNNKRGKAISFQNEGEIRAFSYIGSPDAFHEVKGNVSLKDIVNIVVDKFGNHTSDKLCPYCHNSLPVMSGKYPNVFVSMMGNTGSGKSVYMMQMIHQINSGRLLPGYKFRCTPNNNARSSDILEQYKEVFEDAHVHSDERDTEYRPSSNPGVLSFENLAEVRFAPEPVLFGTQAFSGFDVSSAAPLCGADSGAPAASTQPFPAGQLSFEEVPIIDISGNAGSPWTALRPLAPVARGASPEYLSPLSTSREGQITVDVDWDSYALADEATSKPAAVPLPGATTRQFEEPCIYQVIGSDPENGNSVGFILSIFDFPGEAIWGANAQGEASMYDRHLEKVSRHAAGFVFVFDPSTIGRIRMLPKEKRDHFIESTLGSQGNRNQTLLSQMPKDILRSFRKKFGNPVAKFHMPIAMVVSKSDAIRDQLNDIGADVACAGARFLEENPGYVKQNRVEVDLGEMRDCSDFIRAFLSEPDLDNECNSMADDYLWFSVSATGIAPSKGTLQGKHGVPVRVLDPIEWILLVNSQARLSEG